MLNLLRNNIKNAVGGGFSAFDPLGYDPVLYFDANTGVYSAGSLSLPNLDWDASTGNWNPEIGPVPQVTRATTATRMDANGDIVNVAVNTGRVDYTLGYPAYLIEPAATQLLLKTDFSDWVESGTTISDGAGYKGQTSKVLTSAGGFVYAGVTTVEGTEYTGSIYIRRVSGSNNVSVQHVNSATGSSTLIAVTSDWSRVDVQFLGKVGGGPVLFGVSTGGTDVFEISMPQVEAGEVPTSFIPNTTGVALTRNSDRIVIDGQEFSDMWEATKGTFYTEVYGRRRNWLGIYAFSAGGTAEKIQSYFHTSAHLFVVDGGVEQASLDFGVVLPNQLERIAGTWQANDFRVSYNGGAEVVDNSGTIPSPDRLYLGSNSTGNSQLNGWIKRFIYWPNHSTEL